MPPYIPPKIMKGTVKAGIAFINLLILFCSGSSIVIFDGIFSKVTLPSVTLGILRTDMTFMMENRIVIKIPGPTVERKQARIEVWVIHPNIIIITLGGIKRPNIEETVTKAVA